MSMLTAATTAPPAARRARVLRADIEGLRTIAVGLVVGYHL